MHPKNWKKKLFRNKSLCSLLLMACVVNAEPEEEKVISIDCKDKRNKTVNLEIDLNSNQFKATKKNKVCLLYTSPSPRDMRRSRMPSSA